MTFIDQHRDLYGVEPICKVLSIASSTYYRHKELEPHPERRCERAKRDEQLVPEIQRVWSSNQSVYGAYKGWRKLNREDIPADRCTVERLMNWHGLVGATQGSLPDRHQHWAQSGSKQVDCIGLNRLAVLLNLRAKMADLALSEIRAHKEWG